MTTEIFQSDLLDKLVIRGHVEELMGLRDELMLFHLNKDPYITNEKMNPVRALISHRIIACATALAGGPLTPEFYEERRLEYIELQQLVVVARAEGVKMRSAGEDIHSDYDDYDE